MFFSIPSPRFAGFSEASSSKVYQPKKRPAPSESPDSISLPEETPEQKRLKLEDTPEISLSGVRMQIRNLPSGLSGFCIPREALAQDVFELDKAVAGSSSNANFTSKLRDSKINLLTFHSVDKNGENNRILFQSLIKEQKTLFDRLLKTTARPELAPCLKWRRSKTMATLFKSYFKRRPKPDTKYRYPPFN